MPPLRPSRADRLALLLCLLLVAAACSESEPAPSPQTPQIVTTEQPPAPTDASSAPSTTDGEPSTTGTAATETPPTSSTTSTSTTTTTLPRADLELDLIEVARGFEQPVLALSPPGDDRLFVVDQPGRIWIITGDQPELFVDLRSDVIFGGERGLLGLAFHPDFAANRRFFVNYIGEGDRTRIVEMQAAADGSAADPAGQRILLEIDQPARNHNGGMIAFGPDGFLWVGTGDGGGANDRFRQGQRPDTLLGALLRLDVSTPGESAVPADNPFVDGGGAPEVWSYGLRNPWRFTFDGDQLYVADVGQNDWEEVNSIPVVDSRGANFGWPIREGTSCFDGPCDTSGLVDPVYEYGHDQGCSVTGGFVYRGAAIPELAGHYFFADYCGGWIRSLGPDRELFEWFGADGGRAITSFGRDAAGELYITLRDGRVFRLERA